MIRMPTNRSVSPAAVDNTSYKTEQSKYSSVKRARLNIVTPLLASALDRCKVSDRKAVHIAAAVATSLGRDVNELNINRSSIKRARQLHRTCVVSDLKSSIKNDLKNVSLTVHWDSKLLPDLTGNEKVDRLPILVSGSGVSQLLAVPKLPNGSGEAMAAAVYTAITDWDIQEQVCAMAFDTTSSNTGLKSGACTLLEDKIGRRLLSFACRHHMFEIVLEQVFSLTLPAASTGPDVQLFKRFQGQWALIDRTKIRTVLEDTIASLKIAYGIKEEVLAFAQQQLKEVHPRDD